MPTIITVPNQQIVTIHKERPTQNFLQISNEHWKNALKDLDPHAFQLYLYFACNADNYTFALSPSAISDDIGMSRSTYYKKRNMLLEKGYLIKQGNKLHFYETPQEITKPNISEPKEELINSDKNTAFPF